MRLINPITGLPVEAQGEAVEFLKSKGFRPEPKRRKPAPKKQAKTTE